MMSQADLAATPASNSDPPDPLLSVVVATVNAEHSIDECLGALLAATREIACEIIVVDASQDRTLERVARFPPVRAHSGSPGALVPALWAHGFRSSGGRLVALTIGHCRVTSQWATRLIEAMQPGIGGAGGGFALDPAARASTAAVFFLRYSAYIEERWRAGPVAGEVAGDNAIYARRAVLDSGGFDEGFWEVEVHERLREGGFSLAAVSGAAAVVMDAPPPGRFLRERFAHGRRFGSLRASSLLMRARIVAAAPLVPLVLVARVARRVWPLGGYRRHLLRAVPWLLLFACAWALGEAAGACARRVPRAA